VFFFLIVRDNSIINPSIKHRDIGKKVIWKCPSPSPVWYFESSEAHPKSFPIYWKKSYKIPFLKPHHSGFYFCYGKYPNSDRHFLAKGELIIYGKNCQCIWVNVWKKC